MTKQKWICVDKHRSSRGMRKELDGKTRYKKDAQNNGRFAREKRGLTFDFPFSSFHFVFSSIHVSCPFHIPSFFLQMFRFMFLSCSVISLHVIFMFLQFFLSCFLCVSLDSPIWKMKSRHPEVAFFVRSCRRFTLTLKINDATKMLEKTTCAIGTYQAYVHCSFSFLSNHKRITKEHKINTSFPVVFCYLFSLPFYVLVISFHILVCSFFFCRFPAFSFQFQTCSFIFLTSSFQCF